MEDQRLVKKIRKWKPIDNKRLGRPKNTWEDDVLNDLKLMKVNNWIKIIGNRKEWKNLMKKKKIDKGVLVHCMGGSPGELSEDLVTQEKRKKGWRMNCDVGEAMEGLENEL